MQLSTHLLFAGKCREAFTFYADCFRGSSLTMTTYGDSPTAGEMPTNWLNKIVHATLTIGSSVLSGADVWPEQHERASGFYVLVGVEDIPEAERIFNTLAKDGVVRMPLQRTFWSPAFGVVIDQFGTPWEINCAGERPRDSSSERELTEQSGLNAGSTGQTSFQVTCRIPATAPNQTWRTKPAMPTSGSTSQADIRGAYSPDNDHVTIRTASDFEHHHDT